jgi:hypothetical protein
MGFSEGGRRGGFTDIHHSASAAKACNSTASANAEGDMRSKRTEEALTLWTTRFSI